MGSCARIASKSSSCKMPFIETSVLSNAGAQMLVAAGTAEATKMGKALTFAVCDTGGHLIYLSRMDGCMAASADIATGKARSAALFARETKLLEAGSNVTEGKARTSLLSAGHVLMEGG